MVDVWASWCGPCKAIAPIVDELSAIYSTTLKVVKINADSNPNILRKYKINGIPALLFIKKGELVNEIRGFVSRDVIQRYINTIL